MAFPRCSGQTIGMPVKTQAWNIVYVRQGSAVKDTPRTTTDEEKFAD
jgi:hypothetical protein